MPTSNLYNCLIVKADTLEFGLVIAVSEEQATGIFLKGKENITKFEITKVEKSFIKYIKQSC